ncbi:hypothetical protein T4E_4956 [Trichinella pseudospiralis]|uniref:Uncharacterized protein n=1 Tax=Trichinella pseudospiralis TaxID=6337 RepID=A0A0V0Y387_TRIPS|nr:hypothetical protein T4E_4956 [Trichinella pseudospiralis]
MSSAYKIVQQFVKNRVTTNKVVRICPIAAIQNVIHAVFKQIHVLFSFLPIIRPITVTIIPFQRKPSTLNCSRI